MSQERENAKKRPGRPSARSNFNFNRTQSANDLSRTHSLSSLTSNEEAELNITITELIEKGLATLKKIPISSKTTQEKRSYIKTLTDIFHTLNEVNIVKKAELQDLRAREVRMEERITALEEGTHKRRQDIHLLVKSMPSQEQIAETVTAAVTAALEQQRLRNDCLALAMASNSEEPSPTTGTPSKDAPPPEPPSAEHPAQVTKSPGKNQSVCRKNKRTIVAKGLERLSGKAIFSIITKHNFVTTIHPEKVTLLNYHMEFLCKNKTDQVSLMREFQTHQKLNKELTFKTQTPDQHKMILIGVPAQIPKTALEAELARNYNAHPDEVILLKDLKNKKDPGAKDWILLMPRELGQSLIADGDLILGLHNCPLRPHTSIQRCRNCQSLTHPTKFCQNEAHCANCGKKHPERQCDASPSCVNCLESNKYHDTHYDHWHRASDSGCPSYRIHYGRERERLDAIFNPFYRAPEECSVEHPHQQQSCPAPPHLNWAFPRPPWNNPPWGHPSFNQNGLSNEQRHSRGPPR